MQKKKKFEKIKKGRRDREATPKVFVVLVWLHAAHLDCVLL